MKINNITISSQDSDGENSYYTNKKDVEIRKGNNGLICIDGRFYDADEVREVLDLLYPL